MNNSAMLLRALEAGDTSDTTLSAALDALRDDHGYSLFVAMKQALQYIECGAEARQVAAGCSCIEAGAPHRDRLLLECRSLANVPSEENSTTFVNPGDGAPSAFRSPDHDNPTGWGEWQIFVGALWLLERDNQMTQESNRNARKRAGTRFKR